MGKIKDTTSDELFEVTQYRRKAFIKNVNEYYQQKFESQAKFSDRLGMPSATTNVYLNGTTKPTIDFVIRCSIVLEKSMDELFHTSEEDGPYHDVFPEKTDAAPFSGTYLLYYFDTSTEYGMDNRNVSEALSCGVMSIYHTIEGYASIKALMNISDVKAEQYWGIASMVGMADKSTMLEAAKAIGITGLDPEVMEPDSQLSYLYENFAIDTPSANLYDGNFQSTNGFVYCILHTSKSNKDIATLIMRNPKQAGSKSIEKQHYIGGVGTLLSTSRGREAMPCIQLAIMSRVALHTVLAEEAVGQQLLLGKPKLDLGGQVEGIIKLVKLLYVGKGEQDTYEDQLEEDQKRLLIRDRLESLSETVLEQNLFRLRKVSATEDNRVYHFIKNAMRQDEGGGL